jgi:thiamine kinase-like enzyme
MLAKLHALPTHKLAATQSLEFAREVWHSQSQRAGFPAWAAPLATRLAESEVILARDDGQVLSHGDLNPTNILWDGKRVWLVDWDRAGLSHPYLDLASIANFLSLSDETATALLKLQEQSNIDGSQQEVFKACRDLARIVYGSVFLSLIPDLSLVTFTAQAEAATLSQCFSRVVNGELSFASIEGQALIGAAFLKQVLASTH